MFFVLDINTAINAYDIAHVGFDYSDIFQFVSLASHLTGTVAIVAFLEIVKQQNVHFHAICLQETWLSENSDLSLLQLNGFTCFSQGKQCSSHGGLITYIDTNINASVINMEITSPIWEGLFVKIQGMENTKDIIIGNIYRPHLWQQLQGKY